MDIAMLSMQMSTVQTQVGVGFAMANKVMETAEAQADQLIDMMSQLPSFGHELDIRV